MFRHLFRLRRWLATTLLVVFVHVLAGQCYCAARRAPASAGPAGPGRTAAKPAPMLPGHACCRAAAARKAQAAATSQTAAHAGHHKPGKPDANDDCCRRKAAPLLAALDKAGTPPLVGPALALLPAPLTLRFPARAARKWDRTAPVRLLSPQHLPPKIPDLRIFLRSLTV